MYRKYLPWYMDTSYDGVCTKERGEDRLLSDEIILLNWNVHKNNHHYKWLHDFQYILSNYSPNVIAFQEYQTMSERSIIDKHEEFGYGFFPNIAYKNHMFGLLTACQVKLKGFHSLFSLDVEPLIKTPKVSFMTQYLLADGQTLTLINVHMINFVKIRKFILQVKQIEAMALENKEPLILTGDFNTWSKKRMRIIEQMCENIGLKAVTFEKKHHKKSLMSYPFDHIYYRGFEQRKSLILKEISSSDHKPMLVTLRVSKS